MYRLGDDHINQDHAIIPPSQPCQQIIYIRPDVRVDDACVCKLGNTLVFIDSRQWSS